ncbi:putative ankyrin repeat protein [Diplodia seriata]|uniref:Putative ankyrin repeat protein n=1 Tax=Diplodia seriata TaxID=420778 RepID=A0A0G2GZR2_9PEZI|nr:putative ankyrin repeat protein [Diplodia seriata]
MASAANSTAPSVLPEVPEKHDDFLSYVAAHPDSPMTELIDPYKQYDSKIREVFAQEPDHPALDDRFLNITPVFAGQEANAKIRARNLAVESEAEKEKYIMPLDADQRKPSGSPAVVQSLKEFQTNFNIFSESSLVDMDWSNVVAAGSSVVTPLLPVPKKYSGSKRSLRQYYHEVVAPASDVDLFLYDLSEEKALEKIKQIEQKVKDSILSETTTVRTKHCITIASQYPTRHVQIVLRIYKSVAEILTGFDVDASCAAYDGKQVYASPRALAAYMTQINTVDLTRRSPSYENRLSKYSHRGFEVYWPNLDRSRIDPTIFERNFARTVGLARLLVLEKLPSSTDRDNYMDQRRNERGRPAINRYAQAARGLRGNIKDKYEDEVAEWVEEDEVADYHTFTIPYGEKFHARKIEKLLYTKDLLLNSEWNKPRDREVHLHRHPAFFGNAEDIFYDCCGYCPKPETPEEEEVAEEEGKIYVFGKISFIKDDPGRQTIGSFNPLTDNDWTEMAYVGNTARLCQAIVDGDVYHVEDWLAQEDADPNCRDYTGRTPLHLACHSSSPEIVQRLVDAGARMVARLADGRTALHLAAARGSVEIARILMKRSEANEEEEAKKVELRRKARIAAKEAVDPSASKSPSDTKADSDEEDAEMIDREDDEDVEMKSTTTGSFVSVKKAGEPDENDNLPEDNEEEPDVYDVNVLAWDTPSSPLHLAIFNGHSEVVRELVQSFGADSILPVKLLNSYSKKPSAAILTLCLATHLPLDRAKEMIGVLLELGASSAQADLHGVTAFHRFTAQQTELMQALLDYDLSGAKRALNHLNISLALKLLDMGARPEVGFQEFVDAWISMRDSYVDKDNTERNLETFRENVQQPIVVATLNELPAVVSKLLQHGADPNTLTSNGWQAVQEGRTYGRDDAQSLLDLVREKLKKLRAYDDKVDIKLPKPAFEGSGQEYIDGYEDGSYQQWVAVQMVQRELQDHESSMKRYRKEVEDAQKRKGLKEKKEAVDELCRQFEGVEEELLAKGAKTFAELHPDSVQKKRTLSPDLDDPREKKEPWKVEFSFRIPDLTDKKREGYVSLFEAAWKGDLLAIKRLTLTFWGELRDRFPLKIAVSDSENLSPLQVAVLRGHIECAQGILEIAKAQYKPKEKKSERYIPRVDIAKQESSVTGLASHPLAGEWGVAESNDLIQYAIEKDDLGLLKTLLQWGAEYTAQYSKPSDTEETTVPFYTRSDEDLVFAMRLGRISCLAELIKRTGVGLPLDKLIKRSGVEIIEKPRFYQGLSIHGKKRADWAAAGRGITPKQASDDHPPLLQAAKTGNLEVVEWFLSDAPERCYGEFAEENKADKRLQHLAKAHGGIKRMITEWLDLRQLDMVDGSGDTPLHIVTKKGSTSLMRIIIDRRPELLYREDATGRTPAEMAGDAWTSECFAKPPQMPRDPSEQYWYWRQDDGADPVLDRPSEKFVSDDRDEKSTTPWELCRERWERDSKAKLVKRKLVSLNEANEVARRLGKRQKHTHGRRKAQDDEAESQGGEDSPQDEVASWHGPTWCEFEYNKDGKLVTE